MSALRKCCGEQIRLLSSVYCARLCCVPCSLLSTATDAVPSSPQIIVPRRKKRDDLSILKALSKTVEKDYSAPPYYELDDPYLTPTSKGRKMSVLLSRAQGRKAAQFVMSEYPDSFVVSPINPKLDVQAVLEAYKPPQSFTHGSDTVDGLRERIDLRKPVEAYMSYQELHVRGEELPVVVVEDLLDLLAFFNSCEVGPVFLEEERPYWSQVKYKELVSVKKQKSWQDHGYAEALFRDIEVKTPRMYNSLLRGRVKYLQLDGAFLLYKEMIQNSVPVSRGSYTDLISIVYEHDQQTKNNDTTIMRTKDLLTCMAVHGVEPDLAVFRAVLHTAHKLSLWPLAPQFTQEILVEMRDLNIEPDLVCWKYAMLVLGYREHTCYLLDECFDLLQGREFSLTHPQDVTFFADLMFMMKKRLKDMHLAHRLDSLLRTGENHRLLADYLHSQTYFFNYLSMLCTFEQFDTVVQHYERVVPHSFSPILSMMLILLETLDLNEAYYYLPKLWSDIQVFHYHSKPDLVERFFSVMTRADPTDLKLQQQLVDIVQNYLEPNPEINSNYTVVTGSVLGYALEIYLNMDDYDKAWETFERYHKKRQSIAMFPSEQSVVRLIDAALERHNFPHIMSGVEVMAEVGYTQLEVTINKVFRELSLTQEQKNALDDLL